MNTHQVTARVVGVLFLAGMVAGVTGNMLIQSILGTPDYLATVSASGMKLAVGAILMLLTVAGDAAHGILMFPVLKEHSERMAIGYLGFRVVNAVFLALQVLFVLLQLPLGNEFLKAGAAGTVDLQHLGTLLIHANVYAYQIAMIFVGAACLLLCYVFYKARLVPGFLAVWGLIGYATILVGSALEVMGFDLHLIHTIPGGLWEVFIGIWLIARGFSQPPIAAAAPGR